MINMHVRTFINNVNNYVIAPSARFREVLYAFQTAKETLLERIPPGLTDHRVENRNKLYFLCERIEAVFIRALIRQLYIEDPPPASIMTVYGFHLVQVRKPWPMPFDMLTNKSIWN